MLIGLAAKRWACLGLGKPSFLNFQSFFCPIRYEQTEWKLCESWFGVKNPISANFHMKIVLLLVYAAVLFVIRPKCDVHNPSCVTQQIYPSLLSINIFVCAYLLEALWYICKLFGIYLLNINDRIRFFCMCVVCRWRWCRSAAVIVWIFSGFFFLIRYRIFIVFFVLNIYWQWRKIEERYAMFGKWFVFLMAARSLAQTHTHTANCFVIQFQRWTNAMNFYLFSSCGIHRKNEIVYQTDVDRCLSVQEAIISSQMDYSIGNLFLFVFFAQIHTAFDI